MVQSICMNLPFNRLVLTIKALRELGVSPLTLYAVYQLGLRSGHYRRAIKPPTPLNQESILQAGLHLPDAEQLKQLLGQTGVDALQQEADEIACGQVRLFGGRPMPLDLAPSPPLHHWTAYEVGGHDLGDLKFIWEPARFGWAFRLGMAYRLTGNEAYPQAFWNHLVNFLDANPPFYGPNWISAQEAALRLVAFTFAAQVFAPSPHSTPERLARLAEAVAQHATRIPPTLVYARAQNNNHLVSESLGLCVAAQVLPTHPSAHAWRWLGWRWLNRALVSQIAPDGTYSQHSTN
jgi:hypothetical protein